jgi:hypothetical protein
MYIDAQYAGHLVSKEAKERYHNIRRTSAQTVTLASFIEEMDREVWLMMIDVQGLEAKILATAAAPPPPPPPPPPPAANAASAAISSSEGGGAEGSSGGGGSVLARGDVKQFLVGVHGSNLGPVVKHLSGAGYEILLAKAPVRRAKKKTKRLFAHLPTHLCVLI